VHCGVPDPGPVAAPRPLVTPRLLCLGRLVETKGFDVAVSALALLRHRWPSARLIVAGDGPALRSLQEQAAQLGVAGFVDFIGALAPHDVGAVLNASTVVLVPSRRE